ncbi:hypothetical protein LO749_16835 [Paracoccus denitrificans]|uniref:hypothetical protein n=1 Tax=Paracoccus denitrificans TaxID=266 RepID=UPI001E3642D2|nr:hypothetical protein [Paracoccus denitrificans]UFS67757.1 hypothetical protein LO749_16835 [Paracoccus denitrificans]
MNRRALLAAAPAALVAVPASALCIIDPADTPVMRLFREWQVLNDYLNGEESDALPREAFEAELRRLYRMEIELFETPSQTMTDLAAKVISITVDSEREMMGPAVIPEFWAEIRALVA